MVINGGERAEISIGYDPTAPRRSPPSSPSGFTLHLAKLEGNIGAARWRSVVAASRFGNLGPSRPASLSVPP